MQEKQELLADVVNANQAFLRLQRDHTALLQQMNDSRLKQQQIAQKDAAAEALDTSTAPEQQQYCAEIAAAAAAAVGKEVEAIPGAAEDILTPRLEQSPSSPVKRQRARWNKAGKELRK
jgi:hypothetical protein